MPALLCLCSQWVNGVVFMHDSKAARMHSTGQCHDSRGCDVREMYYPCRAMTCQLLDRVGPSVAMLVRGRLQHTAELQLLISLQRLAFVPAGMPLEVRQAVVDVLLGRAAGRQDNAALQIGEGAQTHQSCSCRLCAWLATLHVHCQHHIPVLEL